MGERQTEDLKVPGSIPGLGIALIAVELLLFALLRSDSRAHGVVVSHPLRMRRALGSIPSVSTFLLIGQTKSKRMTAVGFEPTPLRTGA